METGLGAENLSFSTHTVPCKSFCPERRVFPCHGNLGAVGPRSRAGFRGKRCRFTPCNQLCPKIMISKLWLRESAKSGDVLSWCTSLPVTHPFLKGNSDFSGSSKSCFSTTSSRDIPALGCFFWGAARQSRSKEGQWEGMDAGRSSAVRGYFGNSFLEPGSVSSAIVCTQQ